MKSGASDLALDRDTVARSLVLLYMLDLALAIACFGAYKSFVPHTGESQDAYWIVAAIAATTAGGLLVAVAARFRRSRRSTALAIVTNVLSVLTAFAAAEVSLRFVTRSTEVGVFVGNIALRPTWSEVIGRSAALLQRGDATYFVYDPDLGWTVGPNRQAADGLYFSSAEGIRSATPGVSFADTTSVDRVALIGDSNAFSLEVPYEASLGHHLGELLGSGVQVLNFGVDGYGIDQIYLRYLRDVRRWKPKVVVIVFIQHDLVRTMAVYPFVSFGWPGYLVKPRFDIENDQLKIVNLPLPGPAEILRVAAPRELPYVDYDPGYANTDWDWRIERGPRVLRLLTSISPPWPRRPVLGHADTATLNGRILSELMATIARDGAAPLLIYLPQWIGDDSLARNTLAQSKLAHLDLRDCVLKVPEDQRRVPSGHHYTGTGNRAIAECILSTVRRSLDQPGT